MSGTRRQGCRSHCPVNFGLEVFGDKWSLLIVRDIVFWGKKTYGEFMNSKEGFATNILASRLALLEREGILRKTPHSQDKRKDFYSLTEKGLDLIPVLLEIIAWSAKHDSKSEAQKNREFIAQINKDSRKASKAIREEVCRGGFVFSEYSE